MARGRGAFSRRVGVRGRGGSSRGRGGFPKRRPSNFETSRTEDTEDATPKTGDSDSPEDDATGEDLEDSANESGSEEESHAGDSYYALLQTLKASQGENGVSRKRRKLSNGHDTEIHEVRSKSPGISPADEVDSEDESLASEVAQDASDVGEENEKAQAAQEAEELDDDSSEDEEDPKDPFEQNFSNTDEKLLSEGITAVKSRTNLSVKKTIVEQVSIINYERVQSHHNSNRTLESYIKKRLSEPALEVTHQLGKVERDLENSILRYSDAIFGARTLKNAAHLRDLVSLHALNHVFKTRDRVIKNNAKLSQQEGEDSLDLRDQGFTRPKVLILLPTKQSCVRFIESIVRICQAEQQENKSRFIDGFAGQDDKNWEDKPEDFQDLFGGNGEDMFRLGLKFTRKTIKYFSAFYNSDIILASPLGLMRAIEGSGSVKKDEKKSHDADFLSSIEIAVVDHTNALLMQNWQHVEYIFSQLNLLPKDPHGCDFSRVRTWYLDGHAKYLRQTILLSDYLTPEINSLSTNHLSNIFGLVKYTPQYPGAMLSLSPSLPTLSQKFIRFQSPTPLSDPDARFSHFTSIILAPFLSHSHKSQPPTLIYLPTYASFTRLRNHLSTSTSISFGAISEYSSVRDVARARSHFLSGRHCLLLYTERAHHFRRYRIRGVCRVVFYGVPENPCFWEEVVGYLGVNGADRKGKGKGAVRAMFSKWDVMKLERIVGTERVARMMAERGGDTFEFL